MHIIHIYTYTLEVHSAQAVACLTTKREVRGSNRSQGRNLDQDFCSIPDIYIAPLQVSYYYDTGTEKKTGKHEWHGKQAKERALDTNGCVPKD